MKTKNIATLLISILFSLLFYKQQIGINVFLFTLVLATFNFLFNTVNLRSFKWVFSLLSMLCFGILCLIYPYPHITFFTILSIGVFIGISSDNRLSFLSSFIYSVFNALSGAIAHLAQKIEIYFSLKPTPIQPQQNKSSYKWYHFGFAFTICLIFVFLYRDSSAAFTFITNKIDLSFISIGWIMFTLVSFVTLLGILIPNKAFDFLKFDIHQSNSTLINYSFMQSGFFNSGITLFILLNILLTIVNFSDLFFLFNFDSKNPSLTYSEMIHQGINSLFFSLFLAILFIMIWTNRTNQSNKTSKLIKLLSIIWIFENLTLIITTVVKNNMYINTYGLTTLRLDVYFSLLLSVLLLLLCFYKIWFNKNNWFLFRAKGICLASVFLIYSVLNTDNIIANQNIDLYKKGKISPDAQYLLQLSDQVIPVLYENWEVLNPQHNEELNQQLDYKIQQFIIKNKQYNWQSYNISRNKVKRFIDKNYKLLSELNYQQLEERYNPYLLW